MQITSFICNSCLYCDVVNVQPCFNFYDEIIILNLECVFVCVCVGVGGWGGECVLFVMMGKGLLLDQRPAISVMLNLLLTGTGHFLNL